MLSFLFLSLAFAQSPLSGEGGAGGESTQSCNKYDYYDQGNNLYNQANVTYKKNDSELTPVRDQDSIGWCYSYSAADLYEQWIKDKNILTDNSQSISPMGIALGYETNNDRKDSQNIFTDLRNYNEQRTRRDRNIATKREEISTLQGQADILEGRLAYREHTLLAQDPIGQRTKSEIDELRSALNNPNQDEYAEVFEKHGIEIDNSNSLDDVPVIPRHIIEAESRLKMLKNQLRLQGRLLFSGDEESRELSAQLRQITSQIKQATQDLNQILSESQLKQETDFPEGGFTRDAILTAYDDDYMCFENEFNSRNLQLRDLVQQYTDNYQYLNEYNSSNIKDIMKELYRLNGNGEYMEYCSKDLFLRTLFPSLEGDLSSLIDNLNSEQTFDEYYRTLIGESCTQAESLQVPRPEFVRDYAGTQVYPINSEESRNDRVFEILDEAIENGRIAEVSYLASILDNDDGSNHEGSYHSSVITGKTSICGEDYYILRNSWGEGACESNMRSFQSSQEEDPTFRADFDACVQATDEAWDRDYPACGDDEACKERVNDAQEVAWSACANEFSSKRNERIKMPYFCDGDGNYIISKDHLKTGAYEANYISN